MVWLRMIPVVLSLLVLAAHFLRSGSLAMVGAVLLVLLMLLHRRPWTARIAQVVLVAGAAEWVRTLLVLARERERAGEPAARMIAILATVAVVTLLSALIFRSKAVRQAYRLAAAAPTEGVAKRSDA